MNLPPKNFSQLRHLLCAVCFFSLMAVVAVVTVATAACSGDPKTSNSESGPDHQKAGAREIQFARSSTDTVDSKSGDMTDWKYFRVPATGLIEFTISFDNPDARCVALVRDALGTQLARLENRGQPVLKATFRGEPGIYYLEIIAHTGHSVYTYDVNYEPLF